MTYNRTCIICGKPFETNRKVQKTCSEECSKERNRQNARRNHKKPEVKHLVCPTCGKTFIPRKGSQIYCSADCRPKTWYKKEQRVCVICGEIFYTGDQRRKTCSRICSQAMQRSRGRKDNEVRYGLDDETLEMVRLWSRQPADPQKLDKTLAMLRESGTSYAEMQKQDTIRKWARIQL